MNNKNYTDNKINIASVRIPGMICMYDVITVGS